MYLSHAWRMYGNIQVLWCWPLNNLTLQEDRMPRHGLKTGGILLLLKCSHLTAQSSADHISATTKQSFHFLAESVETKWFYSTFVCLCVNVHVCPNMTQVLLTVLRYRTAVGGRHFLAAAPGVWNCLLVEVRSCETSATFKRTLFTYPAGIWTSQSLMRLRMLAFLITDNWKLQ